MDPPQMAGYESGDENFSDMSEMSDGVNEIYEKKREVGTRIPSGSPVKTKGGIFSSIKSTTSGVMDSISQSGFPQKFRASEPQSRCNFDSDEDSHMTRSPEDPSWKDKILSIFSFSNETRFQALDPDQEGV